MEASSKDLEAKISFLERSLEQLNEVLVEHTHTIDVLKKEVISLKEKANKDQEGTMEPLSLIHI